MSLLDVPGGRLYWEVDGPSDRPGILFLHAGVATSTMWDAQFHDLARDHRVARYDLRGYGRTESDSQPFSNRADAIAVLDAAGLRRATLVGGSRGGTVAIDTAIEFPDRVAGLVTIGSSASGMPSSELTAEEAVLDEEIEALFDAGRLEDALRREVDLWWVGAGRRAEELDPAFVELAVASNLANLHHESLEYTPVPLEPRAWERIAELAVPSLIAVGDADLSTEVANARALAAAIPGADLRVLSGVAHIPSVEAPELVTTMLREWLAREGL